MNAIRSSSSSSIICKSVLLIILPYFTSITTCHPIEHDDSSTSSHYDSSRHLQKNINNNNPRPIPPLVGVDTFTLPSLVDDDRSHGVVFDIRTSPSSQLLAITDIELYTFNDEESLLSNGGIGTVVDYQIYVKEGTWHDASLRDYSPVSSGNLTFNSENNDVDSIGDLQSQLLYSKHRISLNDNVIRLNGNDTLYSLYIGLSQRILPFQHPDETSSSNTNNKYIYQQGRDYIPLITTKHMTIYTGAAAMIYPLSKLNHPVYYRKPRGFLGRIWYEWDGLCLGSTTVVDWDECDTQYNGFGDQEREEEIAYGDVYYGGIASDATSVVTSVGDGSDENGSAAGGGDTSSSSSSSPSTDGNQVYLVITFGEAPQPQKNNNNNNNGNIMNEAAQSSFERVLMEFYSNQDVLAMNDVDLYSVEVWLQQFLSLETMIGGKRERDRRLQAVSSPSSESTSNNLQEMVMFQVTLILTITHSALPHLITRELMINTVRENVDDLFKRLKLTPELVPYLQNTASIAAIETMDTLTDPPTRSPTYAPTVFVVEEMVIRQETSPAFVVLALLIAIYTFSVLFSTCYIKQSRNAMEHEHDMDQLLKSTTIEPDIRGSKDDFLAGANDASTSMQDSKKKGKKKTLFQRMTVSKSKSSKSEGSSQGVTPQDKDDDSHSSEEEEEEEEDESGSSSDDSEDDDSSSEDERLSIT